MTRNQPPTGTGKSRRGIALIGARGCGKSTVGRELADWLQGDLADTDEIITRQAALSITAIFEKEGEAGFRRREREAVAEAVAVQPAVISVGGGAILDQDNLKALKSVAVIVWLTAPATVLLERISSDRASADTRPPLTGRCGLAEIEELLSQRSSLYQQAADLVVDTTGKTPREIAQVIVAKLNRKRT